MWQINTIIKTIPSKTKEETKKGMPLIFIPILLLLGIVPLMTRAKIVGISQEVITTLKQSQIADFFSYYKAIFILLLAVSMPVILFLLFPKKTLKSIKN